MNTAETEEQVRELRAFLRLNYSHRTDDIKRAVGFAQDALASGEIKAHETLIDFAIRSLIGDKDEDYFIIRRLALEVLRNPDRFGTTSISEGCALALIFNRADWLGNATWAYAASRVGSAWLNAIAQVKSDFAALNLPLGD